MSGNPSPENDTASGDENLTEEDVKRAEKSSSVDAPLSTSEEDAYVSETEQRTSSPTEEEKAKNDPTSDRSVTS